MFSKNNIVKELKKNFHEININCKVQTSDTSKGLIRETQSDFKVFLFNI